MGQNDPETRFRNVAKGRNHPEPWFPDVGKGRNWFETMERRPKAGGGVSRRRLFLFFLGQNDPETRFRNVAMGQNDPEARFRNVAMG
jgi:hypothetical protein